MNYIKYKGEKVPVKFSYRVVKNIKDQFNIDLVNQTEELRTWISDLMNQESLFYEMIVEGARQDNKITPLKITDMVDILSQDNVYADLLTAYQKDAILFITPSSNGQDGKASSDKKKAVQTT